MAIHVSRECLARHTLWDSFAFRSPGFVLSALLSLGLGIGVNTAMFSIATEFLLSKPSVADAGSWVSIYLGFEPC